MHVSSIFIDARTHARTHALTQAGHIRTHARTRVLVVAGHGLGAEPAEGGELVRGVPGVRALQVRQVLCVRRA